MPTSWLCKCISVNDPPASISQCVSYFNMLMVVAVRLYLKSTGNEPKAIYNSNNHKKLFTTLSPKHAPLKNTGMEREKEKERQSERERGKKGTVASKRKCFHVKFLNRMMAHNVISHAFKKTPFNDDNKSDTRAIVFIVVRFFSRWQSSFKSKPTIKMHE